MNNKQRIIAIVCGCLVLAGSIARAAEQSVTELIGQLKDKSPAVRASAAHSLGELGAAAKPAAEGLIALLGDSDQLVRRQAIQALGAIRPGPDVTVPLFIKMMDDADPGVRMRVLQAVSSAGEKAVPALIAALKNEKAAYWAILVLRDIGPAAKAAVPALVEQLQDKRPEIRREAILALATMDDAASAAVPKIAGLLGDENARNAATYALGRIGSIPADAMVTIRANTKSDDKMLATVSLWALAKVHPDDKDLRRETTEKLVAMLKDPDAQVRGAAAQGLASLPPAPEITAPIFEKALKDADETVIRSALDSMAGIGAPAVPKLITALKFEHVRGQVAYILGQIGPAAAPATEALTALIGDKSPRTSSEAVIALGKIGPAAKAAVPALVKAFENGEGSNDHAIAFALGQIGPDAAAAEQVLAGALKSSDSQLSLVCAWALTQIKPGSAELAAKTVPVLTAGLALPLPQSRVAAAEALGKLGPLAKSAQPALEKAASDENQQVREAAAAALKLIGAEAKTPAVETKTPAAEVKTAPAPAKTFESGSTVVTLRDQVSLKMGSTVVAKLPKGDKLKVLAVRAPWVGVEATIDGKAKTGWVLEADVDKP
jgi:HEAT repeat protein